MGELWIVLAVSCGLAFLSEKYTLAWNGQSSKALNYGIVILLIAYLSFFAGLRTGYNDTYAYMSSYKAMESFPNVLHEFSWKLGDNPGFVLLNSFMKAIGFRTQTFVLFYSVLFVSVSIIFLKRYSSNFTLSVFLFVCANGYLFSMGAMKQCASIAIGLIGVCFLFNRRWMAFLLSILLAATFHPYILLFLLIPVLQFRPWSIGTWIMLGITLVASLTLPKIIGTIVDTAALLGDGYDADSFIGEGINIFRVLVASVPVLLTILFRRRYYSAEEATFTNCSFIYACIMFIGLFGTANYFGRLASYFVIFPAIVLPQIMTCLSKRDQKLMIGIMVVCYLAYFYYGNAINESFSVEFSRTTLWKYLLRR